MTNEGGCLCGAVRFKAHGQPINVRVCHCRRCQLATGSPFFARALFDQKSLTVEGETGRYASSAALALFDDRNTFAPTEHMWVNEKLDWVKLDDGLRQYPEGPS